MPLAICKIFFCLQHLLVQHIFKYRNAEKKVQTAMHGSTYLLSLLWNLKFQNPKIFFGTVYKNLILKKIRRKISVQLPICLCVRRGKFLLFDVPAIIFFFFAKLGFLSWNRYRHMVHIKRGRLYLGGKCSNISF